MRREAASAGQRGASAVAGWTEAGQFQGPAVERKAEPSTEIFGGLDDPAVSVSTAVPQRRQTSIWLGWDVLRKHAGDKSLRALDRLQKPISFTAERGAT
jgi:hypothetical protein